MPVARIELRTAADGRLITIIYRKRRHLTDWQLLVTAITKK